MKPTRIFFGLTIASAIAFQACQPPKDNSANKPVTLSSEIDSINYAIGISVASGVSKSEIESLNVDLITAGMRAVIDGDSNAKPLMNDQEANEFVRAYMMARQQAKFESENGAAKAENQAYLDENASKEGVVSTESGLQYKVVSEGSGEKPGPTTKVKVHYTGKTIDGAVFDSSVERGEPAEFALNQVIPGWTEGLQLMSVGSKYQFYIPYNIAYGERGNGRNIGPYATLIFDVELLAIVE
ncbi:MAG: FKBP-type peptidyl-prolyl cis-trans isomerase [Salibacteraceae bacterium]